MNHNEKIAQELQLKVGQVTAVTDILDSGNTIPLIACYRNKNFLPLLFLLILHLCACSNQEQINLRRTMSDQRVFSANSAGTVSDFYDSQHNRILEDDTWVFHPDGKFDAVVNINDQILTFSGSYSGDPMGEVIAIFLEFDSQEHQGDNVLWLSEDETSFTWQYDTKVFTYTIVP
jgi:hypothetical protein